MEMTVSTISTIKTQFDLQTRLYNNALEGIEDSQSNIRANEHVNHMKWLAGHILSVRNSMHQLGGFEEDSTIGELFGHGNGIDSSKEYPSLESIKQRWNEISDKISNALLAIPEDMLDGDASMKLPVSDPSMRGQWAFLMHHEAYHIGQLGMLRKYVGKEAMSYG